jgi:hypothetical protein
MSIVRGGASVCCLTVSGPVRLMIYFCLFSFMDSEVLDPGFVETVAEVAGVMRPFVHW